MTIVMTSSAPLVTFVLLLLLQMMVGCVDSFSVSPLTLPLPLPLPCPLRSLSSSSSSSSSRRNQSSRLLSVFTQSADDVYSTLLLNAKDKNKNTKDKNIEDGSNDSDADDILLLNLGLKDIQQGWVELKDMMDDGDLLPSELETLCNRASSSPTTTSSSSSSSRSSSSSSNNDNDNDQILRLDKKGFFKLYKSIDDLFEGEDDDDGEEEKTATVTADVNDALPETETETEKKEQDPVINNDNDNDSNNSNSNSSNSGRRSSHKKNLLSCIRKANENRFSCGFDCTDKERQVIHEQIALLEEQNDQQEEDAKKNSKQKKKGNKNKIKNLVLSKNGKLDWKDVMGEWNLLYTSSRTMIINKSLSGLGRSSSSMAQFLGLRKILTGTKYLGKIEYIETFGDVDDGDGDGDGDGDNNIDYDDADADADASNSQEREAVGFDVRVTGEWEVEVNRRNVLTGMPSSSLRVDPEKIIYGPTTNQADEWASLGPIKLLDILYLDKNLMILRGNANLDSLFVYKRIK